MYSTCWNCERSGRIRIKARPSPDEEAIWVDPVEGTSAIIDGDRSHGLCPQCAGALGRDEKEALPGEVRVDGEEWGDWIYRQVREVSEALDQLTDKCDSFFGTEEELWSRLRDAETAVEHANVTLKADADRMDAICEDQKKIRAMAKSASDQASQNCGQIRSHAERLQAQSDALKAQSKLLDALSKQTSEAHRWGETFHERLGKRDEKIDVLERRVDGHQSKLAVLPSEAIFRETVRMVQDHESLINVGIENRLRDLEESPPRRDRSESSKPKPTAAERVKAWERAVSKITREGCALRDVIFDTFTDGWRLGQEQRGSRRS